MNGLTGKAPKPSPNFEIAYSKYPGLMGTALDCPYKGLYHKVY